MHLPAALTTFARKAARLAVWLLALSGLLVILLAAWLASGRHTVLEDLVTESDTPEAAQVIVCLTGGFEAHALPTADGWDRIYTAVQLQADGFAPIVVFSGGGTQKLSEAEVYADAARWLGCPPDAIVLDPVPGSTAEHPGNLLKIDPRQLPAPISKDTPLLVVTSRLHSKRAALCFRKAGFTNVRLITAYEARTASAARSARSGKTSAVAAYKPTNKSYGDPVNLLRWGLDDTLVALRELAGITVYWWRGLA